MVMKTQLNGISNLTLTATKKEIKYCPVILNLCWQPGNIMLEQPVNTNVVSYSLQFVVVLWCILLTDVCIVPIIIIHRMWKQGPKDIMVCITKTKALRLKNVWFPCDAYFHSVHFWRSSVFYSDHFETCWLMRCCGLVVSLWLCYVRVSQRLDCR